jgi:hypothetical protein
VSLKVAEYLFVVDLPLAHVFDSADALESSPNASMQCLGLQNA